MSDPTPTPAPWRTMIRPDGVRIIVGPDDDLGTAHTVFTVPDCGDGPHEGRAKPDAELAVTAVNERPGLLAEVERLHDKLEVALDLGARYENAARLANETTVAAVHERDTARAELARRPHQYVVTAMATPGVHGVYCDACSAAADDYVWPCRQPRDDVPQRLVAADELAKAREAYDIAHADRLARAQERDAALDTVGSLREAYADLRSKVRHIVDYQRGWDMRGALAETLASVDEADRHRQPAQSAVETPAPTASPTVVCLCGSTRFYDTFQQANYDETMAGRIVLSVGFYPHAKAEHGHGEGVGHDSTEKVALDELHKRKIDLADEVLVLNVGGYIGESTRSEIAYAQALGKPIRWLEHPSSEVLAAVETPAPDQTRDETSEVTP